MSNKYYLLRRNQETLLGPHNLAEIVSLYQNKKCSTNDEISGNTGPWVYLRSRDELKKHYPEMVGIFHGTVAKENLISAYEKYESKPRKSSSPLIFMLFAVVFLGVAAAGYYLYHRHQSDALRSVMKYHRNQDYSRAMEIMRADAALVDKMSVSLASSKKWLPVLRTFAFWDDTKPKLSLMAAISEQSEVKTPANCSQASWRKIWRASMSSWEELLTQQKLVSAHWSLLLSWDTIWLRERTVPHWHYPNSYEHGCFLSAYNAFIGLSLPDNPLATVIRERIMWQARALASTTDNHRTIYPSSASPLLVWNCMEQSTDLKTLDACRRILKTARRTPLVAYSQEKYRWNRLRIIAAQIRRNGSTNSNIPSLAASIDSYNAIDYSDMVGYLANINNQKK